MKRFSVTMTTKAANGDLTINSVEVSATAGWEAQCLALEMWEPKGLVTGLGTMTVVEL